MKMPCSICWIVDGDVKRYEGMPPAMRRHRKRRRNHDKVDDGESLGNPASTIWQTRTSRQGFVTTCSAQAHRSADKRTHSTLERHRDHTTTRDHFDPSFTTCQKNGSYPLQVLFHEPKRRAQLPLRPFSIQLSHSRHPKTQGAHPLLDPSQTGLHHEIPYAHTDRRHDPPMNPIAYKPRGRAKETTLPMQDQAPGTFKPTAKEESRTARGSDCMVKLR